MSSQSPMSTEVRILCSPLRNAFSLLCLQNRTLLVLWSPLLFSGTVTSWFPSERKWDSLQMGSFHSKFIQVMAGALSLLKGNKPKLVDKALIGLAWFLPFHAPFFTILHFVFLCVLKLKQEKKHSDIQPPLLGMPSNVKGNCVNICFIESVPHHPKSATEIPQTAPEFAN